MTTKIDNQPARGLERRVSSMVEFREPDPERRTAWVGFVTYNRVDDYGTVWAPGCFDESLVRKLPKMSWGHNWLDGIGRATDSRDGDGQKEALLQFSDFEAVPQAKRAWTQMRDGDIDEISFGFERVQGGTERLDPSDERVQPGGIYEGAVEIIHKATLYEISPVLVGAVPGTSVLSVRSKPEVREAVEALKEASENLSKLLAEVREEEPEEKPATSTTTTTTTVTEPAELEPGDPGEEDAPTPEEVAAEAQAIEELLTEALQAEALATKVLVS